MTTSSSGPSSATQDPGQLRLHLADPTQPGRTDGAWWPRSRDLHREAADLIDHFPPATGRISRLLFSRPDWDDAIASGGEGGGLRKIRAARGPVKVGSFPRDDTHLMVLTMSSGQRLKLVVIPSDTPSSEGRERLSAGGQDAPAVSADADR